MNISVIIPTYRRPELLIKCLLALLQQRFDKSSYEIIVVSDGPDPDTELLVNRLKNNSEVCIRYLATFQKKGPATARNYGWLNARGRIIAFTDDDTIPDVYWLNEIWRNINHEGLDAITGKVIVPLGKRPTDHERNTSGLEKADFITANCACTKSALIKTGGFDEQFEMAWREDSDLEFKLIQEHIPIRPVSSAIVTHPVRKAMWGVSIKEQKKTLYNALLYKKFPELYREKIQPTPPILYYAIIITFIIMLAGLIFQIKWMEATGFYLWMGLTLNFTVKRLHTADRSLKHIAEMVFTSLLIPFISVYWQWYGAIKYKVFFI